jgi:hypothetical protein
MSDSKQETGNMQNKTAIIEQQETLPYANPYLEAAAEGGNEIGRLLKFVKGEWLIGDDVVPENTEYVAHLDQLLRGRVKFEDGTVVDRKNVGKVANGYKPPLREKLPDTDPSKWEQVDGKPSDPWSEQWYLPLISVETGELVTYATGSKGGIGAIADLCRIYGHKHNGLLPVIALKVRSYKHKKYGKIETPDFRIVGWDDSGVKTEAAAIPVQSAPQTATAHDDMKDEIPF